MIAKGMKLIHVNTRSIYNKIALLSELYSNVDFLCCSETWLDGRIPDNLVQIDDMKIFRSDRRSDITDYNIRIIGGGVCIYVGKKWIDFTHIVSEGTKISNDFETVSVMVTKPNLKKMLIVCVYKPPKGSIEECTTYLSTLIELYKNKKIEIWVTGDFNVDMLKRDDLKVVRISRFLKKTGLTQYMNQITRPNKKGGSCIDLIMTDCTYIKDFGILDDFVSDHFTVYIVRKKEKEHKEIVSRTVRDYRNFDENIFENLLKENDWHVFDNSIDTEVQWSILIEKFRDILKIMCPYKKMNTRNKPTPWLTPEIFTLMKDKKTLIKKYKANKNEETLQMIRRARNKLNSAIDSAKGAFIEDSLRRNVKNPKKFWRVIKCLIDENDHADITSCIFRLNSGELVNKENTPDFLNEYFVNIAQRTYGDDNYRYDHQTLYNEVNTMFDFEPPALDEMYGYMQSMDVNSASCINGVNMKICKAALDAVPNIFRHLFATSLCYSTFPTEWTCAYVTLIPKNGDKTNPGNWRPISQTNIFAKILEKIVHRQMLAYLQENNLLSKYQYGFLPEKSTHEAIFNFVRHMYSAINNNKVMGVLFLHIAKAFNCIDHMILYKKMHDAGFSERVIN